MKERTGIQKFFERGELELFSPEELRLAYAGQQLPFKGPGAPFGSGKITLNYNDLGYNDLGYNDLGYNDLGYNDLSYTESGLGERARDRDSGYYGDSHYGDSYYRDFGGSGSDTSYDASTYSGSDSYYDTNTSYGSGGYSDYGTGGRSSSSGRTRTPAPKRIMIPGAKKIMSLWGEILALIYMLYPVAANLLGGMNYRSDFSALYPLFGVFFDGRADFESNFFGRFLTWHFTLAALLVLVLWTIACVRREKQYGEDTGSALGKYFLSYFLLPVGIFLVMAGSGVLRGEFILSESMALTGFALWIVLFIVTLVNTSRLKKNG